MFILQLFRVLGMLIQPINSNMMFSFAC